jgi:cholesterol oxidase
VGGGSLIYANVSVEAPPHIFEKGWPKEIDYPELKKYYDQVGKMLEVEELPDGQLTPRYELTKEAADKLGYSKRFGKVPLAVKFDENWHYGLEDPHDPKHSREVVNAQGVKQGTCIHLGYCDVGCPVKAKNTLDLNYLARAEQKGTEVRPLHVVRRITPEGSGYRVDFDRIVEKRTWFGGSGHGLKAGHVLADRVVVAAGSLNSTELLLRCRDEHGSLPNLSPRLGHGWSSNGDFLTPAFYDESRKINPTLGPTISAAVDFLDGSEGGNGFYVEDGGFPDLLHSWVERKRKSGARGLYGSLLKELDEAVERDPTFSNVMPWFGQALDAADGRLYLGRRWYWPFGKSLRLDWDLKKSKETMDAFAKMHRRFSKATGGNPWTPPTYTLLATLATPHPLGGCNMGNTIDDGVVDHRGRVFGYPNLLVVDGSIIPEAIGRNPTRTIAAIAERAAKLLVEE